MLQKAKPCWDCWKTETWWVQLSIFKKSLPQLIPLFLPIHVVESKSIACDKSSLDYYQDFYDMLSFGDNADFMVKWLPWISMVQDYYDQPFGAIRREVGS